MIYCQIEDLIRIPPLEIVYSWNFIFFGILLFLGGVDFCHEYRRDNKRPIKLNFVTFPKLQFWTSSLKKSSDRSCVGTPQNLIFRWKNYQNQIIFDKVEKEALRHHMEILMYTPLTWSAGLSNRDKIVRIAKKQQHGNL